jgi:hypothetical protein
MADCRSGWPGPGSFLYELAANNISEKTFKCLVLLPMVGVFGFIFRAQVSLSTSPLHWLVCLVSVVLGAVMFFCLDVSKDHWPSGWRKSAASSPSATC